jgi:tetratricopeptide (TPR) repeat protein
MENWLSWLSVSRGAIVRSLVVAFMLSVVVTYAQRPDPNKLQQWEVEGDTLLSQQRYVEAARAFTRVINATGVTQKSDYNAVYKRAISYYYTEGKEDLALTDIDTFIKEFPYVPQAHILRALIYQIKEDGPKQIEDLNIALDFQPGNAGLLKWRAGLLLDAEEYQKAKADAQAAIRLEDDPEAEATLALAYYNLDQADSALMAINKAIELDYSYMPAYLYAGSFCLQADEFELALKYINLGLRVDPEHAAALFYKGVALVESEKKDEGCRCLNKAFYNGYDDASGYIEQYCYSSEEN